VIWICMKMCCAGIREAGSDPQHVFPSHGHLKPEQLEIDRLRKEVAKLKAERVMCVLYSAKRTVHPSCSRRQRNL
jgi:hypothetical protein